MRARLFVTYQDGRCEDLIVHTHQEMMDQVEIYTRNYGPPTAMIVVWESEWWRGQGPQMMPPMEARQGAPGINRVGG